MPTVRFTPNIQRHVACPDVEVPGGTVREVLDAAFAVNPAARSYVLDDQGAVRRHMMIFVDGRTVRDRERLSDRIEARSTVSIFQALSGG
jgi:sulfur-carrier protein